MGKTKIEWADASWSPIVGCTRKSEGCRFCYSERFMARFSKIKGHKFEGISEFTPQGPRWTGVVRLHEKDLDLPLRWKKPLRIFVNSISDTFHERVKDEWIDRIFAVMALAPRHTFQILTKRSERMSDYLNNADRKASVLGRAWGILSSFPKYKHENIMAREWPLPNVWLGVSVEDQERADERIPHLLRCPAAVRWISAEPLLGPVDISEKLLGEYGCGSGPNLSWIVAGGESGPGARPMHPEWPRRLRDQCQDAGAAFFFKQWGAWCTAKRWREVCEEQHHQSYDWTEGQRTSVQPLPSTAPGLYEVMFRVGKKAAGRLLDGREWNEYPDRSFPGFRKDSGFVIS